MGSGKEKTRLLREVGIGKKSTMEATAFFNLVSKRVEKWFFLRISWYVKVLFRLRGQVLVVLLVRLSFSLSILVVVGVLFGVGKMLLRIGCWLGFHLCEEWSFFFVGGFEERRG